MPEKSILIVHPKDKSTVFLNRIKNHLVNSFTQFVHHYNIYPNEQSHIDCIERIKKHQDHGVVIFLGHGRSDCLFGSKGNLFDSKAFANQQAIEENPSNFYHHGPFINEENVSTFSGKKIFCLACNSNDRIAELAIENGAKTFLGFGPIPTAVEEFEKVKNISMDLLSIRMKTEVNYIIKKSLAFAIAENLTFEALRDYIQFLTTQRLTYFLVNEKRLNERFLLADYLYYFKKDTKVFGDQKSRFLS